MLSEKPDLIDPGLMPILKLASRNGLLVSEGVIEVTSLLKIDDGDALPRSKSSPKLIRGKSLEFVGNSVLRFRLRPKPWPKSTSRILLPEDCDQERLVC